MKGTTYSIEYYRQPLNRRRYVMFEIFVPFGFIARLVFGVCKMLYRHPDGILMLHQYRNGMHYQILKYHVNN